MKVVITGATGFIGKALCENLSDEYEIVALSRSTDKAQSVLGDKVRAVHWDGQTMTGWENECDGAAAIINLAGENIGSGRWTDKKKEAIMTSRLNAVRVVDQAVGAARVKPGVVIQASAIGYYGSRGDEELNENSHAGDGFLAEVCSCVETAAEKSQWAGSKCVIIRSGVVLGSGGGALQAIARPFKYHTGGYVGSGDQWFSWIAREDEVRTIRFLIEDERSRGAYNLTAPEPVRMKDFCKTLGRTMGRRCWTKMPASAARLTFGEMADEMLLASQRVLPERLLDAGFEFRYSTVESCLAEISDIRS